MSGNNTSNNRRRQATTPLDAAVPVSRPRLDNTQNNNENIQNINVRALIAAERNRVQMAPINLPAAASLIPNIDPRNNLTSSDYLFAGWRNTHTFDAITGLVAYSHRGPTVRRAFDRADVQLTVGFGDEELCIGIYGYDFGAQLLESAKIGNVVTISLLAVVEQNGDKSRWMGNVPFILRVQKSSRIIIVNNNNNTSNNGQPVNPTMIQSSSGSSNVTVAGGGGSHQPNTTTRANRNNNLVLIDMFEQQGTFLFN
ncbi:hypothetical protein ACQ4LE_001659 [Meloidogyne hapla]